MRRLVPLLFVLALASAAVPFPPIPPLPASGWPSAESAEPFARELLARVPAGTLARTLAERQELMPAILRNLGSALMSGDSALRDRLAAYVAAVARASTNVGPASAGRGRAEARPTSMIATILSIDPARYDADRAFRERINDLLPRAMATMPAPTARAVLDELTPSAPLDFDTGEAIAAAAHLAPRRSSERRISFDRQALRMPDDLSGPIEASIFSLPSSYFTPQEAKRFLAAVRAASPKRRLVVLGDRAMRKGLGTDIDFVDDHSRPFTPWTRDPFIVARSTSGGVVLINRPNVQPHREEDQNMVRAMVQELPRSVDALWNTRWTTAPAPFHNGQILHAPGTFWISMHTVEPRALALLGLDHVPVETFNEPSGVQRYLDAVRRAAAELQDFYRSPVRFVHSMNDVNVLGGGAGFDLDSILTILPRANGKTDALVGDIPLGVAAAAQASLTEWSVVREAYGFRDEPELLRSHVVAAQSAPSTVALQRFLDEIAGELQRDGVTVRRLPLLNVPASLLTREDIPNDFAFQMTWNNVVLEKRGKVRRAEGFASLLASADRYAQQTFAASGYKLDLYPPLTHSIVLGGGYRCASNHLRP